jgi:hypothetical protein
MSLVAETLTLVQGFRERLSLWSPAPHFCDRLCVASWRARRACRPRATRQRARSPATRCTARHAYARSPAGTSRPGRTTPPGMLGELFGYSPLIRQLHYVISISGRQGMIAVCVLSATIFVVPRTQVVIVVSEVRPSAPLAMSPHAQPSMLRPATTPRKSPDAACGSGHIRCSAEPHRRSYANAAKEARGRRTDLRPRSRAQQGQRGVVQQTVGGQCGAAVISSEPVEVGESAAGLLHQNLRGGHVPGADEWLGS